MASKIEYFEYDGSTLARRREAPYPIYELFIGGEWVERDLPDWDTKADRISDTDARSRMG